MHRKTILFCLLAAGLTVVGCNGEETAEEASGVPAVTLATAALTVPATAGTHSFTYTASGLTDDAQIYCTADVDWITDLDWSGAGTVSFAVEENATDTYRTGSITISVTTSSGSTGEKVTVAQSAGEMPVISVESASVTVAAEGETVSFGYSIDNEDYDGEFACSADADWITGLDGSESGIVRFTAEANETEKLRSAVITLSYTWYEGAVSAQVIVMQDYTGGTNGNGRTGFMGELSDLVGTYEASGKIYASYAYAEESTWTLRIFEGTDSNVIIDGLVPTYSGQYPDTEGYIARGALTFAGQLVVPTQMTGYISTTYRYYIGWTPCVGYDEGGSGFLYNTNGPECTFTYDAETDSWTSDYGMFLALFTSYGKVSAFYSFYDVCIPPITIKKISSDTGTASTAGSEPSIHTDFCTTEEYDSLQNR